MCVHTDSECYSLFLYFDNKDGIGVGVVSHPKTNFANIFRMPSKKSIRFTNRVSRKVFIVIPFHYFGKLLDNNFAENGQITLLCFIKQKFQPCRKNSNQIDLQDLSIFNFYPRHIVTKQKLLKAGRWSFQKQPTFNYLGEMTGA